MITFDRTLSRINSGNISHSIEKYCPALLLFQSELIMTHILSTTLINVRERHTMRHALDYVGLGDE